MKYRFINFFITTVSVLSITGCISGEPLSNQQLEKYNKVAVISLLGDTFKGTYVGPTVFHNKKFSKELKNTSLNAKFEQAAELALNPKFETDILASERKRLSIVYKPLLLTRGYDIDGYLQELNGRGYSGLIIINYNIWDNIDFIGISSIPLADMGLYGLRLITQSKEDARFFGYCDLMVNFYDTNTKKNIFNESHRISFPVSLESWPEDFNSIPAETADKILREIESRISEKIKRGIRYRFFNEEEA